MFTISLEDFWDSGTLGKKQNREQKTMPPQTEEQRGKIACELKAWGSISKATKGLVGRAPPTTAEHREHWTTVLIPRAQAEARQPASLREQGRSKIGNRFAPTCQIGNYEYTRHHWRTTRTSGCHHCRCMCWTEKTTLQNPEHPHSQVGHRRYSGRVSLPTRIRSLSEAQEIAADIPEERITQDQREIDPKKVRPIQMEGVPAKIWLQATPRRSVQEKSRPSQRQCDNSVLVPKEELKRLPPNTSSSSTSARQGTLLSRIKVYETNVLD